MCKKVYIVELSADARTQLPAMLRGDTSPARLLHRVQILLHAEEGKTDEEIAAALTRT